MLLLHPRMLPQKPPLSRVNSGYNISCRLVKISRWKPLAVLREGIRTRSTFFLRVEHLVGVSIISFPIFVKEKTNARGGYSTNHLSRTFTRAPFSCTVSRTDWKKRLFVSNNAKAFSTFGGLFSDKERDSKIGSKTREREREREKERVGQRCFLVTASLQWTRFAGVANPTTMSADRFS